MDDLLEVTMTAPAEAAGRSSAVRMQGLTVLGLAAAFGVAFLGIGMLLDARRDAWQQAAQAADNLSISLAREISRSIGVYDISLKGTAAALDIPGLDKVSPAIRQAALFDKATRAEYLGSLLVVDAAGKIIDSSITLDRPPPNVADREHFQVQQRRADAGLFISRAFGNRLEAGGAIIALSRRVSGPDGSFKGIVVGGMRVAYFQSVFSQFALGANGSLMLLRDDGHLVAHQPDLPGDTDRDISRSEIFTAARSAPSGRFELESEIDHVTRFYTFRRVGDLPLILIVGESVDTVYAAWRHKAIVLGAVLAVLAGVTLALFLLLRRELLRRSSAEAALLRSTERLSVLAATDGLTGTANRRTYDGVLQSEWHRAIRSREPIALLMLDIDYFKLYNDRYGHPDGDRALRAVAACIRDCVRRPGDLVARYGGEEFAVLLPDTDRAGALHLAEQIRAAVAGLAMPHAGSPLGVLTVSIGAAVERPDEGEEPDVLVQAADEALYAAKRGGRDRVGVGGRPLHVVPA